MSRVNTSQLVNAIRDEDHVFADLVPEATSGNLLNIGEIIASNKYCHNAFLGAFYNVIALTRFGNKYYNNHFSALKKGKLGYGETVQEAFVDRVYAKTYSPNTAAVDALKRYIPQVYSALHHMNVQNVYPTTLMRKDIDRMFASEQGVSQMIDKILQRPYDDAEADDEDYIIRTMGNAYNAGVVMPVAIPDLATSTDKKDDMETIVEKIREFVTNMEYRNDKFNALGVSTHTPVEDLVVIMDAAYEAAYGVRLMSAAFNTEYAKIPAKIIKIPSFANATGMKILLCDKDFIQNYEILFELGEPEVNGFGLYTSYPLHKWSIYDISPFANAIAFTTDTVGAPSAVTATMSGEKYNAGDALGLNVTVAGSNVYDHRFTVEISGNVDPTTCYIGGAVYFGKQETSAEITIKVSSLADPTKNATVTISNT